MQELAGQVFLITGGGGAIGGVIARRFGAAGARLGVLDLPGAHLDTLVAELPDAVALPGSAFAPDAVQQAIEHLRRTWGRFDGLIHCVGGFAMGSLADSDDALYDRMFDLNTRSSFYALRAGARALGDGPGLIAALGGAPAWTGQGAGVALYAASKAALVAMMRALEEELSGSATVALPIPLGIVDTPANRRAMPDADPATWIDPAAIADALIFAATRGPRGRLFELPIRPPRG